MFKVAVVIPALNEERFISQCLDSVIAQSYPLQDMDIMVVDGGSKDKTCEIVERYHKKYDNIRLLNNPRKIQSIAFNIGVANSSAPFIVRLDAHVLYNKNYIELCIKRLEEDENRGNVGGMCKIVAQNNSIMAETNAILNYSKFGIGGASFRVGAEAGPVDTVPFGAFRRIVLEQIGGMREDLPRGEDNEINSRIKKNGYEIFFDPNIVSTYYARATFKASAKQMYANGESIGILYYIDKNAIGLRHLVPVIFVLGVIGGAFLSLFWHPIIWLYLAGLSLYFICDLVASVTAAAKYGWKFLFPLFILFFMVHMSYGWGTIRGLMKRKYTVK